MMKPDLADGIIVKVSLWDFVRYSSRRCLDTNESADYLDQGLVFGRVQFSDKWGNNYQ
jgi:hypothetical protein